MGLVVSLGRVAVPSLIMVINLPRTYEKLHYKREPYRFSSQRDPSVQIDILLLYYKDSPFLEDKAGILFRKYLSLLMIFICTYIILI